MSKPRKYAPGTEAVAVRDAAIMLGVSTATIHARIRDGIIRSFKIGKLRRISRKALDELMQGEKSN